VKVVAQEEELQVLQPEKPRGEAFPCRRERAGAGHLVVVAYGHILPKDVIDLPARGTLNIHASLLPRWRGAAPIQAAILAGDAETGVSIIADGARARRRARPPAGPHRDPHDETGGELAVRLSELGALAIVEALTLVSLGDAGGEPQDEAGVTYAGKVSRESARSTGQSRPWRCRASSARYDPVPGAYSTLRDNEVKLFRRSYRDRRIGRPGSRARRRRHGDAGGVRHRRRAHRVCTSGWPEAFGIPGLGAGTGRRGGRTPSRSEMGDGRLEISCKLPDHN
jgi:methionyl-tRNA formyltransferase